MSTQVPLQVTGIAFAVYLVTDLPRARRFYEQTLGLRVCAEMEFQPGLWWIEYDTGAGALALTNNIAPTEPAGRNSGVALEVTNYDTALATLQAAGVALTWGPNEFPVCRCCGFQDPDGNTLYLHQRKVHS